MADSALNRYLMQGTSTQRASYTPSPATVGSGQPLGVWFFETDTGKTYGWNQGTSAWVQIVGGALPSISTLNVLANDTAGSAMPTGITVSALLDMVTGGTSAAPQGDILYRGASGWALLGPGTSGQVLQTNGASANPSWVTPSGGGGGGAMTLIGSVTTTSGASNITFSSIPGTYNHLKLIYKGLAIGSSAGTENLYLTINSDAGSNYGWLYQWYTGGAQTNGNYASQTPGIAGLGSTVGATTGTYSSSAIIDIPGYTNTTFYKEYHGRTFGQYGNTGGNQFGAMGDGQWNNTAAITSLKIQVGSRNFVVGSQAWLYGIT